MISSLIQCMDGDITLHFRSKTNTYCLKNKRNFLDLKCKVRMFSLSIIDNNFYVHGWICRVIKR